MKTHSSQYPYLQTMMSRAFWVGPTSSAELLQVTLCYESFHVSLPHVELAVLGQVDGTKSPASDNDLSLRLKQFKLTRTRFVSPPHPSRLSRR